MTEKEILEALERQMFGIEQKLRQQGVSWITFEKELPQDASLMTHNLQTFRPVFVSNRLLSILDVSREEFVVNPSKAMTKHLFPGDFEKSSNLITRHLLGNKNLLPITFIQRNKLYGKSTYEGIYTLSKKTSSGNELLSIGIPIRMISQVTLKMLRILDESLYVKRNYQKFASLTTREREIITLLALGSQNNEIGDQLFISKATVEQHRKNLKRKLEIKRFVDLIRFAQAFDMI